MFWLVMRIASRFKVQLLRRAWAKGAGTFAALLSLLVRERIVYRELLVFTLPGGRQRGGPPVSFAGLAVRHYRNWDSVGSDVRAMLLAEPHDFGWDVERLLGLGWELWTGFVDGQLAFVCWTRGAEHAGPFRAAMGAGDLLIGPAATAGRFRGRGIFTAMLGRMARELTDGGCRRIWIACARSNVASRRAIERNGFALAGRGVRWALGDWDWRPGAVPAESATPALAARA
jgi:hypothetical protein